MKVKHSNIGRDYVLDIERDDRGRLVAEVWHKSSGKTLGITEVDDIPAGEYWAKRLIAMKAGA